MATSGRSPAAGRGRIRPVPGLAALCMLLTLRRKDARRRVGFAGGSSSAASVNDVSDPANADTGNIGGIQGISGDGSTVFFSSSATNLDPGPSTHRCMRSSGPNASAGG